VAIYEQAMAAAFVLLLLGGLVLLWRRQQPGGVWPARGRTKSARALIVEERVALSTHHCLFVVRLRERRIVVATHPAGTIFGPEIEEFGPYLHQAQAAQTDGAQ
jgi:hypothetical protein